MNTMETARETGNTAMACHATARGVIGTGKTTGTLDGAIRTLGTQIAQLIALLIDRLIVKFITDLLASGSHPTSEVIACTLRTITIVLLACAKLSSVHTILTGKTSHLGAS